MRIQDNIYFHRSTFYNDQLEKTLDLIIQKKTGEKIKSQCASIRTYCVCIYNKQIQEAASTNKLTVATKRV